MTPPRPGLNEKLLAACASVVFDGDEFCQASDGVAELLEAGPTPRGVAVVVAALRMKDHAEVSGVDLGDSQAQLLGAIAIYFGRSAPHDGGARAIAFYTRGTAFHQLGETRRRVLAESAAPAWTAAVLRVVGSARVVIRENRVAFDEADFTRRIDSARRTYQQRSDS